MSGTSAASTAPAAAPRPARRSFSWTRLSRATEASSGPAAETHPPSGHRLGLLTLRKRRIAPDAGADLVVQTPGFVSYTRRGSSPHLTGDLHGGARLSPAFGVSLEHVVSRYAEGWSSHAESHPGKLSGYCNLQDRFVILWLHDPAGSVSLNNTKDHVTLQTGDGKQKVTCDWFVERVRRLQPDAYVALADQLNEPNARPRRVSNSAKRSLQFLDACLADEGIVDIPTLALLQGADVIADRQEYAKAVASRNIEGYVAHVSGLVNSAAECEALLGASFANLPDDRPRLVHGVNQPDFVLAAISAGADVFDGAYPFMAAEAFMASLFNFVPVGQADGKSSCRRASLGNPLQSQRADVPLPPDPQEAMICLFDKRFSADHRPLQEGCGCYACRNHTRAYIHHLVVAHEMLALTLLMQHNSYQYDAFFDAVRRSIQAGTFPEDRDAFLAVYKFNPLRAATATDNEDWKLRKGVGESVVCETVPIAESG